MMHKIWKNRNSYSNVNTTSWIHSLSQINWNRNWRLFKRNCNWMSLYNFLFETGHKICNVFLQKKISLFKMKLFAKNFPAEQTNYSNLKAIMSNRQEVGSALTHFRPDLGKVLAQKNAYARHSDDESKAPSI